MKKTFIVTGGAGFIGSNLVRALNERGHESIIVVDHLNHAEKQRNLNKLGFATYWDKKIFRGLLLEGRLPKVTDVLHIGACSSTTETDDAYLDDNNYQYTRDMCEWALAQGARFIYASSAATYGDGSHGYVDDDKVARTLEPLNGYGRSKQKFDLWAIESGTIDKIVGLKYFNVYGPGEDHKGEMRSLVNKAYDQLMSEGLIRLFKSYRPEYKDGEQVRDFVYVDDAVAVTLFFMDHPEINGLFNCGTGITRSWVDLAKALFAAVGKEPRIEFIDIPDEIRDKYQYHTQADLTKLRAAGYSASFLSIEEGVKRYVEKHLSLKKH